MHEVRPEHYPYRVVFTVLPARSITNALIPPGDPAAYVTKLNARTGFYDKLEASIRRDGIRNPLLVAAGACVPLRRPWLPPGWEGRLTDLLVCDQCGGSRLWVAQRLGLDVPCVVSDFVGRFAALPDLRTREAILARFADTPRHFKFTPEGVHITSLPHTHLKDTP